ncbi:MAG: OmpP1/FadL family transporter [Flavobacteriaceae bacterium]
MLKHILIVFVALFSLNTVAQEGSASPYSFYGIGEQKFRGTVENKSMGGLSVYSDSIHLNMLNPASLGKLKMTNFNIGGNQRFTTLKTSEGDAKGSTTTIDYIAVGLPMGKLAMSFGLMPYSSVGYKTGFTDHTTAEIGDGRYEGSGGINRGFLAAGYQLTNKLSLGVDVNYNFGKITTEAIEITSDEPDHYNSMETNETSLKGLGVNLGITYATKLKNNLELVSGLTYSPEVGLNSKNNRRISAVKLNSNGQVAGVRDVIESDAKVLDLNLPSKLTLGVGIGKPKRWFAGIDISTLSTSKLNNRTFNNSETDFKNATKLAVGGFYIPKYNSLTNYTSRVTYRAGMRYENTGLVIKNEDINEFGISFGVGLPVGRKLSNVNLGFEYGSRGTTNSNLVKENFINLNISLSFNDKWFQKRKID